MITINDRIFIETGYMGCNVGCVLTDSGPVLIDTPALPADNRDWLSKIRERTQKRIAFLIYTHEHFDHVCGGAYLTKNIIAHRAAVEDIKYLQKNLGKEINSFFPDVYKMYKQTWDSISVISPRITFAGRMNIYCSDAEFALVHVGGHSPASIIVYLPRDKVLFCGDIADRGMPFVTPYSKFGEWLAALRDIENMDAGTIISGHGEVCGKEDVRKVRVYFEAMQELLYGFKQTGLNKTEALARIDIDDFLPVPKDETVAGRVKIDAGFMWEEVIGE